MFEILVQKSVFVANNCGGDGARMQSRICTNTSTMSSAEDLVHEAKRVRGDDANAYECERRDVFVCLLGMHDTSRVHETTPLLRAGALAGDAAQANDKRDLIK